MLEGLERISWERLRHAQGGAEDVPHLIRALMSRNEATRQAGMFGLRTSIWHHGQVYEATPYAVPFLIELIRAPALPDKDAVLTLLAELATGTSAPVEDWLLDQVVAQGRDGAQVADVGRRRRSTDWARAARAAVREGLDTYRVLELDPDPLTREAAKEVGRLFRRSRSLGMAPAITLGDFPAVRRSGAPVMEPTSRPPAMAPHERPRGAPGVPSEPYVPTLVPLPDLDLAHMAVEIPGADIGPPLIHPMRAHTPTSGRRGSGRGDAQPAGGHGEAEGVAATPHPGVATSSPLVARADPVSAQVVVAGQPVLVGAQRMAAHEVDEPGMDERPATRGGAARRSRARSAPVRTLRRSVRLAAAAHQGGAYVVVGLLALAVLASIIPVWTGATGSPATGPAVATHGPPGAWQPPDGQGVYEGCGPSRGDVCLDRLNRIAAGGFRLVLNYDQLYGTASQQLAYAGRAHALGLKIIWAMDAATFWNGSDLRKAYPTLAATCGCADSHGFIRYVVGLVKDLPATWGYYIGDETLPKYHAQVLGFSNYVREVDPHHPRLFISDGAVPAWGALTSPFTDTAEVIGPDIYPFGPAGLPVSVVGSVAKKEQSLAAHAGKSSALVLQAFMNSEYADPRPGCAPCTHFPTRAEMREMLQLALANSHPRLILWYSYFDILRSDDPAGHWADLVAAAGLGGHP